MQHHPYALVTVLANQAVTGNHPGPAYYAQFALAAAAIIVGIYYAIRFARNRWSSQK